MYLLVRTLWRTGLSDPTEISLELPAVMRTAGAEVVGMRVGVVLDEATAAVDQEALGAMQPTTR